VRREAFFLVDASLMQQLGASLITDDLQALVELIKNSYDADASKVQISIDAPDSIVVTDDGHGMDEATIERGWLTISNSLKLIQKRAGTLTAKRQRTPLGDKGLGRLSTQRLGSKVRIDTVPEVGTKRFTVEIDWTAFRPGEALGSIPVTVEESSKGDAKPGTRVTVTELLNPDDWVRMKPEELRTSLAGLVSPYSEVASFRLQAFLNGVEVSPSLITSNIRGAAWQHYKIDFNGEQLEVSGSLKAQFFRGATPASREDFARFLSVDNGSGFLSHLLSLRKSKDFGLRQSERTGFLLSFTMTRELQDVMGRRPFISPGPFVGEVDSFSLDAGGSEDVLKGAEALGSAKDAREMVKALSGIRVYRDGFIVKTAHDWLQLGEAWTGGGSYYGLKPFNTMGYIAIRARENAVLRETTDREGFVADTAFKTFFDLLQSFVRHSNLVLEHLRRTWVEYCKQERALLQELPSRDPDVIASRLSDSFERVADAKGLVGKATQAIEKTMEEGASSLFPGDAKAASKLSDVQEILSQAAHTLDTVGKRRDLGILLVGEVHALNERLGEVYELVSLGITAEALSHEISNVLERLAVETNNIQKHARSSNLQDLQIARFFEVVRTTVGALERQISHLDPALKFAREKRETFSISSVLKETAEYYAMRYAEEPIEFDWETKGDFQVSMNRGKLVLVLDNLILNAEYWVKVRQKDAVKSSRIQAIIESPRIIIDDTGPGVEPTYEETLFDPFTTAKPKGTGRGLGLFIATQLLELDGCTLSLLSDRNRRGRRYRFAIDLSGVLANA